MTRELALSTIVASIATSVAAIAGVGLVLGFAEPPAAEATSFTSAWDDAVAVPTVPADRPHRPTTGRPTARLPGRSVAQPAPALSQPSGRSGGPGKPVHDAPAPKHGKQPVRHSKAS